jgi:hypothetical protein
VCLFPVVAQGTCEEGAIGSDQALVHDELLHRWASAYIDTDAWRADVIVCFGDWDAHVMMGTGCNHSCGSRGWREGRGW